MPTIAINAPLDPNGAGGVETNLLSMLKALSEQKKPGYATSLLALPRYVEAWTEAAPRAKVEAWPLGQTPRGANLRPIGPERAIRRALGQHAHLFDGLVDVARAARHGRAPDDLRGPIKTRLRKSRIDAIHFPTPQFFDTDLPFLYEPWDLQYLHYPDFFSEAEFLQRDRIFRRGCHKAALVLTATEWVKADIVKRLGVSPRKIVAIPRASMIAQETLTEAQIEAEITAMDIRGPFIFYPAMCFEHKNHIRLLRALARLRDRDQLTIPLVLSGRIHKPFMPRVTAEIEALGLGDQVKVLGPVSNAALTALFRRARFMVFPSLFEGLGLPVLEAFHHGLPVLAARETCLPEVIDDAGVLFDAKSEDAIAAAIRQAWTQPESLASLPEKGRRRLDAFSWSRGRSLLNACYKHTLGMPLSEEEAQAFARATQV